MKIKDVIATLEVFAPLPLQEEYDNAGLQVGVTEAEISGVVLCLDVTEEVLAEAVEKGCNMVVAHHPLLFRPLRRLGDSSQVERCVRFAYMLPIPTLTTAREASIMRLPPGWSCKTPLSCSTAIKAVAAVSSAACPTL